MMKRIFMLLALALMLVAAMALSGVAQAASPKAKCQQEATSLGLSLDGYNVVVGNNKNNDFTRKATDGADVFCGFGGNDLVPTLAANDIFIGGAGNDTVSFNYGTVYGGAGDDEVNNTFAGAFFYGGDGGDYAGTIQPGDNILPGGTVYGGAGDDVASAIYGGTFNGGDGNDFVFDLYPGGSYYGGNGTDEVVNDNGGFLDSVEILPIP